MNLCQGYYKRAVINLAPMFRVIIAPKRPRFDSQLVCVGFVVTDWHWDMFSKYFSFPSPYFYTIRQPPLLSNLVTDSVFK